MDSAYQQRLSDLENRFMGLENKLNDSPEKEAISILHAMFQESLRAGAIGASNASRSSDGGPSLQDIANLYKHAPSMEGDVENTGISTDIKAPEFSLMDASGKKVSLTDFRGRNVVLVFYPLDWSPACSDQLSLYQRELDEFERANAQLLCISVDSIYSHGAWAEVRGLKFPLLSDFHPKGEVAKLYGVWRNSDGFSERAIYVIDAEGMIRYKFLSSKIDHIPDIYDLLNQLKQVQGTAAERE